MKTAKELWQYVSKMGLKPLPKTSVSQWADDYRMLSQGLSAEPGRWKTSRAPYQKDIMDEFSSNALSEDNHKILEEYFEKRKRWKNLFIEESLDNLSFNYAE
ncbi:hypothetical protein [uncultured Capnocytophaga sp.]|uniref:hypothetical protein n=1 Tax=uncultured Capnocytophaga sp. TaxID=159273 RepID=UPI002615A36B|nr:hypothetical protein [uncultured Capnocytophaga sp.]